LKIGKIGKSAAKNLK